MPIETPTMENLSTLTGKYGDEGDKLLFRILDSGDFLKSLKEYNDKMRSDESQDATFLPSYTGKLNDLDAKATTKFIAEKGLRYDLTVPFARYVVMNRNEIRFHLSVTKCNLFGVPTDRKKAATASFGNVMQMW